MNEVRPFRRLHGGQTMGLGLGWDRDRPPSVVSAPHGDRDSGRLMPAVVSASLAQRLWPGQEALGKEFSRGIEGEPGTTYCFAVRATDRAGNRSGWSPMRCTSVPLRSLDLEAEPAWVPVAGDHYAGTASMTLLAGSTLRTGSVHARRVALVVTREPGAGRVEVLWNGDRIAVFDLEGPSIRNRFFLELPAFRRVRTGRITVRTLDAFERVVIEAVGVARA